jgi:uncharacterized radical SAM superfamily Fe-S cluster-containing enzyme
MVELEKTSSICPACYKDGTIKKIDASIVKESGKVYMKKKCDKHGDFKDIYFSDLAIYNKWIKYKITGVESPDVKIKVFDEPALYDMHKSQTVLTTL